MQFAAALVEYLVTGCGALLWIALALGISAKDLAGIGAPQVALLLPLLYVVGMSVDAVMSFALRRLKHVVRGELSLADLFSGKAVHEKTESQFRTASIVLSSQDLGRELQLRSSRDRIARGALLNVLVLGSIAVADPTRLSSLFLLNQIPRSAIAVGTVVLTALAFSVWWHYEYNTHQFKKQAIAAIGMKEARRP